MMDDEDRSFTKEMVIFVVIFKKFYVKNDSASFPTLPGKSHKLSKDQIQIKKIFGHLLIADEQLSKILK